MTGSEREIYTYELYANEDYLLANGALSLSSILFIKPVILLCGLHSGLVVECYEL